MTAGLYTAAVIFLLVSFRKLYRRHFRRAIAYLSLTALSTSAAVILHQIQLNLESYASIHNERDVAEVDQRNLLNDEVVIVRDLVGNRSYHWQAKGEMWRLELRILSLKGFCKALGWPDYYRLSSLKATDPTDGNSGTVHSVKLQSESRGWDLWRKIRKIKEKRPDLVREIESCLDTDLLITEAQPLRAGSVTRFYFMGDELRRRSPDDLQAH